MDEAKHFWENLEQSNLKEKDNEKYKQLKVVVMIQMQKSNWDWIYDK